jgi:hypothetical protein
VHVHAAPPFVNPPKRGWNNDSVYENLYEGGWETELLGVTIALYCEMSTKWETNQWQHITDFRLLLGPDLVMRHNSLLLLLLLLIIILILYNGNEYLHTFHLTTCDA